MAILVLGVRVDRGPGHLVRDRAQTAERQGAGMRTPGAGPKEPTVIACKCGGDCGLTFVRTPAQRCRRYAEHCPVIAARRKATLDKCRARQNARLGQKAPGSTKRCSCVQNCGRTFVNKRHQLYHPECPFKHNQIPVSVQQREPVKMCQECYDISDRRPKNRRCQCGELFAPEPNPDIIEFLSNRYLP